MASVYECCSEGTVTDTQTAGTDSIRGSPADVKDAPETTTKSALPQPHLKVDSKQRPAGNGGESSHDLVLDAVQTGDLARLRALHARNVSLLDAGGRSPLFVAASSGHREVVKYLLGLVPPEQLAALDPVQGQTPLHAAAGGRHRAICYLLVASGAPLLVQDRNGLKPFDLAQRAGDQELADYFQSQERFYEDNDGKETVV